MNKEWLSTGEVADVLSVSRQHVVDLCERGELPFTRVGSHRRVRKSDVELLLAPKLTLEQEKSLWLHRAVLGALMTTPDEVLENALQNLDRWEQFQRPDGMTAKYFQQWRYVINSGIEPVVRVLIGRDSFAIELRQNSPFAGVLSDDQRLKILTSFRQHHRLVARDTDAA